MSYKDEPYTPVLVLVIVVFIRVVDLFVRHDGHLMGKFLTPINI